MWGKRVRSLWPAVTQARVPGRKKPSKPRVMGSLADGKLPPGDNPREPGDEFGRPQAPIYLHWGVFSLAGWGMPPTSSVGG